MISLWWFWLSVAVVLGLLELFVPGSLFLGFAIGAAIIGVVLLVGGPLAASLSASFPLLLVLFGVFSLVAWIALRKIVGVQKGQRKDWDTDINDN